MLKMTSCIFNDLLQRRDERCKIDFIFRSLKMEIPESHIHFAIKTFHPWSSFLSQEVWACWHELLSYLEKANKWLNEVELKLKTTENIPGGAEEISEVLSVSSELV